MGHQLDAPSRTGLRGFYGAGDVGEGQLGDGGAVRSVGGLEEVSA